MIEEDDEDVVMETTDIVSRKRKAAQSVDDVTSVSKKHCITDSELQANAAVD